MTKLNVFIKHEPTDMEAHIELDAEMTKEDYERFLANVLHTFTWLNENNFAPSSRRTVAGSPTAPPAPDVPNCPDCSGEMWDNRADKASGNVPKNRPDFKCKNPDCGKAIWPKKKND